MRHGLHLDGLVDELLLGGVLGLLGLLAQDVELGLRREDGLGRRLLRHLLGRRQGLVRLRHEAVEGLEAVTGLDALLHHLDDVLHDFLRCGMHHAPPSPRRKGGGW